MKKSKIEDRFPELKETDIPYAFYDKEGVVFTAKADSQLCYLHGQPVYIELKDSPLNSKRSIRTSTNRLREVGRHHGIQGVDNLTWSEISGILDHKGKRFENLRAAWNHSVWKQAAVAKGLEAEGIQLLLVTTHTAPITFYGRTYQFQDFYAERFGITAVSEQQLREWIDTGVLALEKPKEQKQRSVYPPRIQRNQRVTSRIRRYPTSYPPKAHAVVEKRRVR